MVILVWVILYLLMGFALITAGVLGWSVKDSQGLRLRLHGDREQFITLMSLMVVLWPLVAILCLGIALAKIFKFIGVILAWVAEELV